LVARDEGFFRDEGLDVEILVTPGSGQHNSDDRALKDDIFKRTMEALYDQGQCDQFRMCEWGIMKRAVEVNQDKDLRKAKIVALGSAMSSFAIVVDPRSGIYEPEQLKNVPIAVSAYNGSHFTMLKMMEGFIKRDEIKIANAGTHRQRMEAVMNGQGEGREPAGALDQRRRGQGRARADRIALDPQRGGRRRDGRPDARQDVPRGGARRGGHPEESRRSTRTISWKRPAA
jgi:hypothetical protein